MTDGNWKAIQADEKAEHQKALAWMQKQEDLRREADRCPCGHDYHQHQGECTVRGCSCQEFGEPIEEEYTKVYFGDPGDDMGSIGYE